MPRQKSYHVDDPAAVGRRLREARERAGLSQRELAFAGCSAAYISRIEAGARIPSLQLLREFGRRLGVSADYLASGAEAGAAPLVEAEVALRLDDLDTAAEIYTRMLEDDVPRIRAEALEGLAEVAARRGESRRAIELFEQACDTAGWDPVERPGLADTMARAYASAGELAASISLLRRCVERYRDDPIGHVRFAALLSCALTDGGDFAGAHKCLSDALTHAGEVRDPYTRARLYWSQSRLLAEQGQPEAAERYARRTVETLRLTDDTYAVAHALETLAHICLELERAEEALELLEEGDPLITVSGTRVEIAHYRLEQARALAAVGDRDRAVPLAMEAAGELSAAPSASALRAYLVLGEVFADLGDTARAQELYELAIEYADAAAPNKYLVEAYRRLAALLKEQGRRDEALELLERALPVQQQIGAATGLG
jgi:tetratricopeptide (TPR) repeat protein